MRKGEATVSILLALSLMIVLTLISRFIGIGLGTFYIYNMPFSLNVIAIAVLSSVIGTFVAWRFLFRTGYMDNRRTEVLLAVLTSALYLVYSLVDFAYNYPSIAAVVPLQWVFQISLGSFVTSLIGTLIGFVACGFKLQRMPPPLPPPPSEFGLQESRRFSPTKAGSALLLFLLIGAVAGYFIGYISWIVFGQIQVAVGVSFPYAALLPPPSFYLIGWVVVGALSFPFKIIPSLLK
jgi:hypothetical protein